MQHINQAVQNVLATPSTPSPVKTQSETEFPITWVSALFKRLQAIYGHRFTSRIDGIERMAIREWAQALRGLTGAHIKAGIEKCVTRKLKPGEEDWPPTPAEFRSMCLPECVPACHRSYITLPRPPQDPDVQRKALEQMRTVLGEREAIQQENKQ